MGICGDHVKGQKSIQNDKLFIGLNLAKGHVKAGGSDFNVSLGGLTVKNQSSIFKVQVDMNWGKV